MQDCHYKYCMELRCAFETKGNHPYLVARKSVRPSVISTTQDDDRISLVVDIFSPKSFYSALKALFTQLQDVLCSIYLQLCCLHMRPIFTLQMSKADACVMRQFWFKNILTSQDEHKRFSEMIIIQIQ